MENRKNKSMQVIKLKNCNAIDVQTMFDEGENLSTYEE